MAMVSPEGGLGPSRRPLHEVAVALADGRVMRTCLRVLQEEGDMTMHGARGHTEVEGRR
jgi:hypothetical protein